MVPNDWSLKRFDSVAELIHGFQFREHHFSDSGVPVIKIGSISNLKNINLEECSFIPEELAIEFTKYAVNPGDVLMALTGGTLGKTCRVQDDIVHCVQNYRVGNFKPKNGLLDKQFLYYFLISSTVQKRIENIVNEAAQPNVGKADFEKIKVLTPPLSEQKKIAKILSTWDKAITTTEQLLANSQQQKKALMQQLLTGKKRLLDNKGVNFRISKTPYTTLPSDWHEVAMEQVSSFITKGATPTTYGFDWQDTGIPFLRSECVGEDGFKESGLAFICDEAHETMKRSKVFTGDLLITITGNVGRICKLPEHISEANVNQHIAKITLNSEHVNTDFIYHCLQDNKYRRHFERITTGQAYPQISLVQVRDVLIPLPSYEEQQKIAAVLSTADREIEALQQKLGCLKQEKKALMQQLLTGKRRVKVEEAA